jgi:hypothetical protein
MEKACKGGDGEAAAGLMRELVRQFDRLKSAMLETSLPA